MLRAMDSFHTRVEVRSHWQIYPDEVFSSTGDPREVEPKWATNSELVIDMLPVFLRTLITLLRVRSNSETVKITCEPVGGVHASPYLDLLTRSATTDCN